MVYSRNNEEEGGYVRKKKKDVEKEKLEIQGVWYRDTYLIRIIRESGHIMKKNLDHDLQHSGWEDDHPVTRKNQKNKIKRYDQIREINDITRPITQTDHLQNNINSGQLTLFSTEIMEGSHSNKIRTTSTLPFLAAWWMGRFPSCYEEETRKRVIWSDMRYKRYNKTDKADRSHSKQYQLRSTYIILNRNSGRITLQQHTNHFHVTIPCSIVDGKETILLRGRNEKESDMIR